MPQFCTIQSTSNSLAKTHLRTAFFQNSSLWLLSNASYFFKKGKNRNNSPTSSEFNPIQDGLSRGCSRMGGSLFASLPPKIRHTYPTMMKLGTVIPYLRKIKKIYKSPDTFLDSCRHRHFLPEISKFCHIKNYTYRLDFDT